MPDKIQPLSEVLNEPLAQVRQREQTTLDQLLHIHGNRVVLFGCGGLGRRAIEKLRELDATPLALCDNNQALWGTTIDEIPIQSIHHAAQQFGQDSLFIIAVWNPHHWFAETEARLRAAGAQSVISYLPLYWRFPNDFLQVYMLNDLPTKVYEAKQEVLAAEKLWADDLSLHIYRANILYRALGNPEHMPPRPTENTYFPPDIFAVMPGECVIDCGAYDGDTVKQVLSRCGPDLAAIYSLEGDDLSFHKLEAYAATLPDEDRRKVHLIHGAVGGTRTVVRFTSSGGTGSKMDADDGIDDMIDVQCYPIDDLEIDQPVTLIKMDIEGAEYDSILGARSIIARDQPLMAVCVYHLQHDIWRLPLLLHDLLPNHLLFLRAYEGDGFQTVAFSVPPSRALSGNLNCAVPDLPVSP